MDVSPMSMQMIVPRATDAGQVQHNLNQASALQSDYQALEQKREDELKQQQVREKDNPEDGRIKDDPDRQKKQGGGSRGRRRGPGMPEEQAEEPIMKMAEDPSRGHLLDISL
ncbi:hypothetical protein SELR_05690 [Selenomonas ruminantium subsp. lactilytica TAM6421]|uniref:Uncharacterized protein n=2 Tax=Selenomonas ruminantium TaxID=971 RepID=I0GNE0_SELRL|nr:hypothetical protein SELR_05690 [Selenomonas ruminantium subsp. lactilytica TAM6421]